MTTEQKALALVNEVSNIGCYALCDAHPINLIEALCRAIEQHEAAEQELADVKQELSDYKQKVSDAVEKQAQTVWDIHCRCGTRHPISFNTLEQFIIPAPKSDPLFDVLWDLGMAKDRAGIELMANRINETLEARGLEIREKNGG